MMSRSRIGRLDTRTEKVFYATENQRSVIDSINVDTQEGG